MTVNANIQTFIGGHERVAYTVEHRGNCVLITGAVPASALTALTKLVPEDSVMDPDAARMVGCTFAFGPADELEAIRKSAAAGAIQRQRVENPGLSEAATRWLASGERGVSSNTIFAHLTGIDALRGRSKGYPYDPSDFRRCQMLLDQVPELQPHFHRMREVSPQWANLVDTWPAIVAAMDEEAPGWRDESHRGQRVDKAYDLIRSAIGS